MKRTLMIEKTEYLLNGAAILAVGIGICWAISYALGISAVSMDRFMAAGLVIGLAYLFHEHIESSEAERRNLMSAVNFYKYDMVEIVSTDKDEYKDMIGKTFMVTRYDRLTRTVVVSRVNGKEYEFEPSEVRLDFRSPVGQRMDAEAALIDRMKQKKGGPSPHSVE